MAVRAGARTGSTQCELVVIGCSWGGLLALERLLVAMPDDFAVPLVVAQHRGVDSRDDLLTAALGAHTGLVVRGVDDKDPIEPGCVHLAPPDYHLLVERDGFALSTEGPVQFARPSIDVLFDSAAEVYGERLAAVVLTGANEDGAAGLRRVRERGGFTLVQDPDTAERREMPEAAIGTGRPHAVASLEEIAATLAERCSAGAVL